MDRGDFKFSKHIKQFNNQDVIFQEGSKGREMYVILKGNVEISQMVNEESNILSILKPGDFFGEMSTIRAVPRVATAKARGGADCLVVSPDIFKSMLQQTPGFGIKIIKELCNRVESVNKQVEKLMLLNQTERVIVILSNMATDYGNRPIKAMKFAYNEVVDEIAGKTKTEIKTVEKAIVTLARYGRIEIIDTGKNEKYIQVTEKLMKHGH